MDRRDMRRRWSTRPVVLQDGNPSGVRVAIPAVNLPDRRFFSLQFLSRLFIFFAALHPLVSLLLFRGAQKSITCGLFAGRVRTKRSFIFSFQVIKVLLYFAVFSSNTNLTSLHLFSVILCVYTQKVFI